MSDKDDKPRDPNQPTPKPAPEPSSFGAKIVKTIFVFALVLFVGSVTAYSLRIDTAPWQWTADNWQGYLTFSKENAQQAKDKVQSYDWSKIGAKTKALWDEAPDLGKRIERKLGMGDASAPGAATQPPGAKLSSGAATVQPAGAPIGGTAALAGSPEHVLGLKAMREGIEHYRNSPDDPVELQAAKRSFEEAQGHLEKAVKETKDDQEKAETASDLRDCNRYLEDCRSREKS